MSFARRLLALASLLLASLAHAEVVRIEITQRVDVLNSRAFGAAGAYEWLEGRVHFALDPANTRNHNITDLQLAPRNAAGQVEFSADIAVLQPKVATRANGVVLMDVVNHGERSVLRWLQFAEGGNPASLGDAMLLNQGVTLVWVGWQQDLPDSTMRRGLMRLRGPVLEGVTGWVTGELVVDTRVTQVALPQRFPVADRWADDSVLAVSGSRAQAPRAIPGDYWAFARMQDGKLTGDNSHLHVDEGFVPGAWYTYAYRAVNPVVTGLGLVALRDMASWLKHDVAAGQPIARAKWVYAFGADQGGRFLRQFLHDGFNEDAAGRQAFDAMLVHGAGASRTGFNERFAQPSGTLSTRVLNGAVSGAIKAAPKVFYTTTAWDYWGGGASFAYTTQDGKDAELPAATRVYHFAGAPQVRAEQAVHGTLHPNPLDVRPGLRGLYVTLDQWVRAGTAPVASRHPLIATRELVPFDEWDPAALASTPLPRQAWPMFGLAQGEGAPSLVNPRAALVPQLDTDGNELAGIRMPTINVALAAHTGWNLRAPTIGAPREMLPQVGGAHPRARTREERNPRDPRGVITETYASRADYLKRIAAEAASLVTQRLMLKEDVPRVVNAARVMWDGVVLEALEVQPAGKP